MIILAAFFFVAPFKPTLAEPIKFNSLTPKDGLSQVTVYSILQADDGRIWIGTADGIDIYDGYRFERLRHDPTNENSISVNYTRALLRDTDGDIWIGTLGGGLNNYHHSDGKISRFSAELPGNDVYSLLQLSDGKILAGTDQGIGILEKSSTSFSMRNSAELGLNGAVRALTQDTAGNIWLGSSSDGVCMLKTLEAECQFYRHQDEISQSLSNDAINFIVQDSGGQIWIGTEYGGLNRLTPTDGTFEVFRNDPNNPASIGDDDVTSMFEDDLGNFWFGTWSSGLNRYNPSSGAFEKFRHSAANPKSPISDTVISLFLDHSRQLWMGTYAKGVSRFPIDGDDFVHFANDPLLESGPGHNTIWSFAEDAEGAIWVGSRKGLDRLDRQTGSFEHFRKGDPFLGDLSSDDVRAILPIGDDLWIGTARGGLAKISQGNPVEIWRHDENDPTSLAHDTVRLLLLADDGWLWVGTQNGVSRLNPNTGEMRRYDPDPKQDTSLPHRRIRALYQDPAGVIWIGTSGGVSRYRPKTDDFQNFSAASGHLSQSGDDVRGLLANPDGTFWVATSDGLNLVDFAKGLVDVFRETEGLPNDTLYSVIEDADGFLWLTTNNGLARFDPETRKVRPFKVTDGLQSNEFNFNAHLLARDGTIFVGGVNGFNQFAPQRLNRNQVPPIPHSTITALDAEGSSLVIVGGELPADTTEVRFGLAPIHYQNPVANSLAYRLLGLSDRWQTLAPQIGEVRYPALPPGEFIFEARFASSTGVWTEALALHEFSIAAPIWQRWWALALAALVFSAGVYFLVRSRLAALRRQASTLQLAVDAQTAELSAQRDAMAELTEFRERFLRRVAHELRTPLSLIRAPLEMIASGASPKQTENVQRAGAAVTRLERVTDEMLRISMPTTSSESGVQTTMNVRSALLSIVQMFQVADEKNLRCELVISSELAVSFDQMLFEDAIYNLISNAFRHSDPTGSISITAKYDEDALVVGVTNTGVPLPKEKVEQLFAKGPTAGAKGAGVGLNVVHDRVAAAGGNVILSENQLDDICFTVRIPATQALVQGQQKDAPGMTVLLDGSERPVLLVVEDDLDLLATLQHALEADYQLLLASNLMDAGVLAFGNVPDCILSDIMLPDGTGKAFLKTIRENVVTSHIPFVFLTALSGADNRLQATLLEANDYITKPFSISELQTRLANQLTHRERIRSWLASQSKTKELPESVMPKADQQFLETVDQTLITNIGNPDFTMEDLIADLGMSRRQLERKLNAVTGATFLTRLIELRIQHARQLLVEGKLVKQVALEVGYRDPAHFSRVFERQTGQKPSDTRKANSSK